jgi:2-hydroxy-4-carboxymuconate semialdehyde hemiacetal dehydrogenase
MNLCFVGYGSIAEEHVRAFRQLPEVEFETVVGRVPEATEAFATAHGFRRCTLDLSEALENERVDAVVITSPSDLHGAQAEAALRAGKDVLVEIPLATNLADAERVAAVARSRVGRRLMVAHTQRFHPALIELRRQAQTGDFRPRRAICRWLFLRRENMNWKGRRRSWTDNLLWHHACHVVDAICWTLGTPEALASAAATTRAQASAPDRALGIPLDIDLFFQLGAELPVNVAMSYNSPRTIHDYLVVGERATVVYANGSLRDGDEVLADGGGADPVLEQDREFAAALREERAPAVSADDVLPAMRILQAAQDQIAPR